MDNETQNRRNSFDALALRLQRITQLRQTMDNKDIPRQARLAARAGLLKAGVTDVPAENTI